MSHSRRPLFASDRVRPVSARRIMVWLGLVCVALALDIPAARPAAPAQESSPASTAPRQDPQAVADSVRAAARAVAPPDATLTLGPVDGAAKMPECGDPLSVSISGVAPYEQAAAHCKAPPWTLYVTVTVAETATVAVAARPIAAGQTLGADDIVLRREPVALFAGRQVYYDPAQLVGTEALMSLPAGAIVTSGSITQPVVVKAGQTVTVEVTSGGVTVQIDAVASQPGRIGDTILFTNPSSGRHFTAQITAAGPVLHLQS